MYKICPKCGHDHGVDTFDVCAKCGLVFEKWLHAQFRPRHPSGPVTVGKTSRRALLERLGEVLLWVDKPVAPLVFGGRLLLWAFFLVWGVRFILMDYAVVEAGLPPISESIMHSVNLVFHEAGHVIFSFLGRFMTILGGSLAQLLMPAIVTVHLLLRQRDVFGATIGLWWVAQSLMDLAPYINDARAGRLLLLGGGSGQDTPGRHDWHNLLGQLGMLDYDHALASLIYGAGVLAMTAAFVWGAAVLWHQFHRLAR